MRAIRAMTDWLMNDTTWQLKQPLLNHKVTVCFVLMRETFASFMPSAVQVWKTLGARMRKILKRRRYQLKLEVVLDELRLKTLSYLVVICVGVPAHIFYIFPMLEWMEECVHNSFSCDVESSGWLRISGWRTDTQIVQSSTAYGLPQVKKWTYSCCIY